jgi:hypothetical protein
VGLLGYGLSGGEPAQDRQGREEQRDRQEDENTMIEIPQVTAVEVVGPEMLRVWFKDGLIGDADLSRVLGKGPVFAPLEDPAYFALAVADPGEGTVGWPNGANIAPETLCEWAREHTIRPRRWYMDLKESVMSFVPARG